MGFGLDGNFFRHFENHHTSSCQKSLIWILVICEILDCIHCTQQHNTMHLMHGIITYSNNIIIFEIEDLNQK